MKNIKEITIGLIYIVCISFSIASCRQANVKTIDNHIDSVIRDSSFSDTTTNKYSADAQYFEVSRELNLAKDSIEVLAATLNIAEIRIAEAMRVKDSIARVNIVTKEKLGVAEYKLLRIREYNRIAAQGNNLKYLRGWIIRTLNH